MSLRGEIKRICNIAGSRKMSIIYGCKPSLKKGQDIVLCRKCQVSMQTPGQLHLHNDTLPRETSCRDHVSEIPILLIGTWKINLEDS